MKNRVTLKWFLRLETTQLYSLTGPHCKRQNRLACQAGQPPRAKLSVPIRGRCIGDIGTGKDLEEYPRKRSTHPLSPHWRGQSPAHNSICMNSCRLWSLICFNDIVSQTKCPSFAVEPACTGRPTQRTFRLHRFPKTTRRNELEHLDKNDLVQRLQIFPAQHVAGIDTSSKKELFAALKSPRFLAMHPGHVKPQQLPLPPFVHWHKTDLKNARWIYLIDSPIAWITGSLKRPGICWLIAWRTSSCKRLGLEYKFLSLFCKTKSHTCNYSNNWNSHLSILQSGKWPFRKMEKEGVTIHWVEKTMNELLALIASHNLRRQPYRKQFSGTCAGLYCFLSGDSRESKMTIVSRYRMVLIFDHFSLFHQLLVAKHYPVRQSPSLSGSEQIRESGDGSRSRMPCRAAMMLVAVFLRCHTQKQPLPSGILGFGSK